MSTFARVLRHAERDRLLREEARRRRQRTGRAPAATAALLGPPEPDESRRDGSSRHAVPSAPTGPAESPDGVEAHLVSLLYPASLLAETYRVLRHRVEQIHRATDGGIVLAVSSPGVGDGKTTTSINLAGALAQAPEARVLLVDVDLRYPSIARHLALETGTRGLVDAILDPTRGLDTIVGARPPFNLDIVAAGIPPSAPYEILESPRLGDLLLEARRRYDYVVLDTAPLVPVPDSRLVSRWVDGILLVIAAHKTPRRLVAEALNLLDPARLVGIVFNEDDGPLAARCGYPPYGASLDDSRRSGWRSLRDRLGRLAHV